MPALSWNTIEIRPGRARVRGKWSAWLDSDDRWKELQPRFRETPDGFAWTAGPSEYHIGRHLADGARIVANNRFDIFARQPINAPAAEFELNPIGGANVAGQFEPPAVLAANYPHVAFNADQSQVWHPEAGGPGLHVRWTIHHGRAPRMTRELVVDPKACPRRNLSLAWDVRSPRVLALVRNQSGQLARPWNGSPGDFADVPASGVSIVSVPDQAAADQIAAELAAGAAQTTLRRGAGIRPPLVWYWKQDGTLVTAAASVRAEIQSDGETVRFTKTIPLSVIEAAAAENSYVAADDSQTIYPDADAETVSCDGYVGRVITSSTYDYYGGSETYAQLIANPGTEAHSGNGPFNTSMTIYHFYGSQFSFYMRRLLLGFDLSALTGTASAADLVLKSSDANAITLRATGASPVSPTAVSTADYQSTYDNYDTSLSDDTASGSGTTTLTMNAAGLSYLSDLFGSVAFLAARLSEDKVGGTRPGVTTAKTFYQAEYTGQGSDPYLEVTYGESATSPSRSGSLSPGICIRC